MTNDITQKFITILVVSVYGYLVITNKANVEGFAILATYVIKKALDLAEIKGDTK